MLHGFDVEAVLTGPGLEAGCGSREDGDLGGRFTLKRYHSEKTQNLDGTWGTRPHRPQPDTAAEGYEPIVVEASGDEEVWVNAEYLGVAG